MLWIKRLPKFAIISSSSPPKSRVLSTNYTSTLPAAQPPLTPAAADRPPSCGIARRARKPVAAQRRGCCLSHKHLRRLRHRYVQHAASVMEAERWSTCRDGSLLLHLGQLQLWYRWPLVGDGLAQWGNRSWSYPWSPPINKSLVSIKLLTKTPVSPPAKLEMENPN